MHDLQKIIDENCYFQGVDANSIVVGGVALGFAAGTGLTGVAGITLYNIIYTIHYIIQCNTIYIFGCYH